MTAHETLQSLRADMERQKELLLKQAELTRQKEEAQGNLRHLRNAWRAEESDVEMLEGRSLTALFYTIIGQRVEKLDRERREAYAAKLKYDAAQQQLIAVEEQLQKVNRELSSLDGCEARYESFLHSRQAMLRASGTADGERLIQMEKSLAAAEHMHKEILEARVAGDRALDSTRSVEITLKEAKNLGVWDMLSGSTLVSLEKHDRLDRAQDQLGVLQEELRSFKTELVDIRLHADLYVKVEGFTRFADWFFDNLWVDWEVQDHITSSLSQIKQLRETLEQTMVQLERMLLENDREAMDLNRRLRELTEGSLSSEEG